MVGRRSILAVILIMIALFTSTIIVHAEDTPDQALHAKLAAYMLTIPAEGQEYSLDCGRSNDVVSVLPASAPLRGDYYCVMNTSGKIIFGTFRHMGEDTSDTISSEILSTFQDKLYNETVDYFSPIGTKLELNTKGCGNYEPDPDKPSFHNCRAGTIKGMYPYVFEDWDVMYVLVSTKELPFDQGVFDTVIDWLKSFFGVDDTAATQLEVLDHFDYAYFANIAHRHISAQWYDTSAFIIYQNFSTDINTIKPDGSEYYPGHDNKQIIAFNDFAINEKNILLWRKYTAGLRITSDGKDPFAGDVCGNNNVGFDEECEPGKPEDWVLCKDLAGKGYSSGRLTCNPVGSPRQCLYNTTDCISCVNNDGDPVSGGQGASGALSVVSYANIGMSVPYGPFETFDPTSRSSTADLLTARKLELHLGYEVVPITYDMAIPNGTSSDVQFTHAIDVAESQYASCKQRNGGAAITEDAKNACERQAYANITTFNPLIAAEMQQIIPTASSDLPCTFREVLVGTNYEGRFVCPDGETPSALGIDSPLKDILGNMKISNVNPIIKINLGKRSDIPPEGRCTGTHQACSAYSAVTCAAHAGCSVATACTGSSGSCSNYGTKISCNSHRPACSWVGTAQDGSCDGAAVTCDPSWDAATCAANNCVMGSACTGTAHTCTGIAKTACDDAQHKGCTWTSGTAPTESKLPTKAVYTEVELRKIRGYCFATAKGLGGYWNGIVLSNDPGAKLKNFIIIGDPKNAGMSAETYNSVYQSCRKGIKDALGDGARVLHGLPSDEALYTTYTQFVSQTPYAYDGLYVEPKIICTAGNCKYAELSAADYANRYDKLKDTNVSITALADISFDNSNTNYGTRDLLDLTFAKTRPIIFNKDKSLSSFEGDEPDITEVITNKTLYWNTTLYGLQGKTIYSFKDSFVNEKPIPNTNTIKILVADVAARSSIISIHNFGAATQFNLSDFNLSKCNEKSTRFLTQNEVTNATKFNGAIPANSIVTILLGENVSCIAPTTGPLAACGAVVDCNDADGSIYPGAREICGDGIDSNCDGADSGSGCVANGNDITTSFVCSYDTPPVCDDGEDRLLCRDCAESQDTCPKEVLFKQYTGFNITLLADGNNNPKLKIVSKTAACKINGTKLTETYNTTGTTPTMTIFNNGTSTIKLSFLVDRWKLEPQGDVAKQLKPCWGSIVATDIKFVSVPVCVPGTGGDGCIDDSDCPVENNYYCEIVSGVGRCKRDTGPSCFIAGTPITTPNGVVPIEQIVIGDKVSMYDTTTHNIRDGTVVATEKKQTDSLRILKVVDRTITTTDIHPFYTKKGWIQAGNLQVGELLLTQEGVWTTLLSSTTEQKETTVYNLEIGDSEHNFFANGILVHNKQIDPRDQTPIDLIPMW